jgi:hypothetical protein
MLRQLSTIWRLPMSLLQVKKVVQKVKRFRSQPVEVREEALWKSPLEEWDPQE